MGSSGRCWANIFAQSTILFDLHDWFVRIVLAVRNHHFITPCPIGQNKHYCYEFRSKFNITFPSCSIISVSVGKNHETRHAKGCKIDPLLVAYFTGIQPISCLPFVFVANNPADHHQFLMNDNFLEHLSISIFRPKYHTVANHMPPKKPTMVSLIHIS